MSTPFYDLASLVVVPSGYKASKVYAQKPLTTDGQLAFTRSTTATRVNSAGLIEASAVNVPRLDYTNSTCPKLLLEPSRTNVAIQNTAFDNAAWTKNEVTLTANVLASPDGTTNADSIVENSATNAYRRILPALPFTGTGGAYYTFSFYVKKIAGQPTRHIYWMCQVSSDAVYAHFNMTTFTVHNVGTSGSGSNASATITAVGNDWYRITLSGIVSSAGADYYNQFYFEDSPQTGFSPTPYTGNGTSGFYLYGWQIEQGAYATSLINTTTAAVTRLADAASKTSISSLIGQTEGTIFWELDVKIPSASGLEAIVNIDNGAGFGNTIYIYQSNSANLIAEMYVSGVTQASMTKFSITAGVHKCALAYANNNTAFFVDGVQVGSTDTSCSVPATSRIQMGATALSTDTSWTKQLLLFKTRLTNAQLSELTTI